MGAMSARELILVFRNWHFMRQKTVQGELGVASDKEGQCDTPVETYHLRY